MIESITSMTFKEKFIGLLKRSKHEFSSIDFLKRLTQKIKEKGLYEKYYDAFIEILMVFNENIDNYNDFSNVIYKEIKSLIVNCPKNLQNIEIFQALMMNLLKKHDKAVDVLEVVIKLL